MEEKKMVWGIQEIAIIAGIAVMLFGAPKVIEWARALGTAKKEFEQASKTEILNKQKESAQFFIMKHCIKCGMAVKELNYGQFCSKECEIQYRQMQLKPLFVKNNSNIY